MPNTSALKSILSQSSSILTVEQHRRFVRDGFAVIPGFYDLKTEIEPIQRGIYAILKVLIAKYKLPVQQAAFSAETFDSGYQALLALDRKIGGEVYDAVKQIPAFLRFVASEKHDSLMRDIRSTEMPGIAGNGYGIRINNPNEEKYRAPWHQDYPAQLRSFDGIVVWSPLMRVTEELGPVEFCVGSHKAGPIRVHTQDPKNPGKSGAYGLILENEEALIARYPKLAPLSQPGDLVLIDYHSIHRSGFNRSNRSLWTMQIRLFNFQDPTGIKMGWCGSFMAGKQLKDVLPELVID